MKITFSYLKQSIAVFVIAVFSLSYQSANAQSPGDIIKALNAIRASLDGMVNTAATYIFQTPSNIGNEVVTNNTLHKTAIPTVVTNVKALNDQDILAGLDPQTQNLGLNLTKLAAIQASDTVVPSITLGGIPVPFYSSSVQSNMQKALIQGNENFNFTSLIGPLSYSDQNSQNIALNFIHFMSGYATPVSTFNLNSFPESQLSSKQKLDIQNSANYQSFQVQRRQVLAQQSVILNNLYWMYQRRLPISTIQAGDTGLGVANPSVAQIENYNATWRASSPTWYTQMSTASETNVQREMLFVLAELQAQVHRLHQDNERMIALMTINQLSNIQASKQLLAISEKQVQDNINQLMKTNADQGTSTQSTGQVPADQQKVQADRLNQAKERAKAEEKSRNP
ncbi:MAG: hypothetical protein H0U71_05660 [Gammaproteobacteria bacterium]|nr:hypothetical protein [Gammaproteobacteria bacterium]